MRPATIATITDVGFGKRHKVVRAAETLKTIEIARSRGYRLITVDAGSPPSFVRKMRELGAEVYPQAKAGMGNAQRQVLALARDVTPKHHAIVYTESEKHPLFGDALDQAVRHIVNDGQELVMFRRLSMDSYPPEQAMSYQLIALAMKYLTGIDSDFGWGPTVLSRDATAYYTGYVSSYGDSWDAIHCPKLAIIHAGRPWTIVPIDYTHPPDQRDAETGMTMLPKRIEQAGQLIEAMTKEVDRLGMRLE